MLPAALPFVQLLSEGFPHEGGPAIPRSLKPRFSPSDEAIDASPAFSAGLRGVPLVDDLIKEFLAESNEGLERMDSELVKLEADPGSAELLASIFRAIHTIKGTCGFLGFEKLGKVAHAGENVLSKMRDGQLALTPAITSVLLQMVDAIRAMLTEIANSGSDGDGDYTVLIEALKQAQQPGVELRITPAQEEGPPAVDEQSGSARGSRAPDRCL